MGHTSSLIAFIDSEVGVSVKKIHDLGAVRSDGSTFHSASVSGFAQFIAGCDYVCGHNIIHHDLPHIGSANVGACRYDVPDYWTMGEVFERLIKDVTTEDVLATLHEVYDSWMCDALSNYNSDLFYQPRDYLRECYLAGEILAA